MTERVVTPWQLEHGYRILGASGAIWRGEFAIVRRLVDGNYLVYEPAPTDQCGAPCRSVWRCVKPPKHDGTHAFEVRTPGGHDHGYYVDGCKAQVFPMVTDDRNQDWD